MPGSSYEVVAAYEAVVIGGQYGAHMLSPECSRIVISSD